MPSGPKETQRQSEYNLHEKITENEEQLVQAQKLVDSLNTIRFTFRSHLSDTFKGELVAAKNRVQEIEKILTRYDW